MHRRITFRRLAKATRDESAQGLVEFALVASVLFLVFLGTVDFARFLYYQTAIQSAARVGAESASNHCAFFSSTCELTMTPTSDTLVLWETYCEANPNPALSPAFTSCTAGTSSTWTPTCSGTCTNCSTDICVSPSSRTTGTEVTVTVGYSFKPFTLLISPFFTEHACYSGDSTSSNHHTICAQSVGRVS
jgi:Flp pilus assembly protein TadG